MWHELKISKVEKIEKCVAEYQIWMHTVLPYGTDVRVRRKFDGEFEGGVGYGKSIEEALEDTIGWFLQVVDMDYPIADYPDGLTENDIEYVGYSDF